MAGKRKEVGDYRHEQATRLNNPTAALAREDVAPVPERTFSFDPHLDPQLLWAGKAEQDALTVEAPSIHVHERLSTEAIMKAAQRENAQIALFADPGLDRATQVEFYEHEMGWANRLVLGDSLVALTSLLERERMAGQVSMVYIDPPYGINYNSNFQARISVRSPKETADDSLTREPEQIQAYRDTWELGIHSYLTYLRERLVAARELLTDEGSVFVQIGPENVHLVRVLLDEVFGPDNACTMIVATTTSGLGANLLPDIHTHILWYAKDRSQVKFRQLYGLKGLGEEGASGYLNYEMPDGTRHRMTPAQREDPSSLPQGARPFMLSDLTSQGYRENTTVEFELDSKTFHPGPNRHWQSPPEQLRRLAELRRLEVVGNSLRYVRYIDDFGGMPIKNVWTDMGRAGFGAKKRYVVETVDKLIARCLLMTTDPGDLVVDPTCGSGTTAFVAERYGRRWITIDTSRVALALARERILTAGFPFFELVDSVRGVDAGFRYDELTWTTLRSLAYDDEPERVALLDRPRVDASKVRVSGPFTVEALSRYADNPFDGEVEEVSSEAAADHVTALLDALRTMGIPRKGGGPSKVVTLEPLAGAGVLHAAGRFEDAEGSEHEFAVSLGPRHGPVTVAQIDEALAESPGYDLIVFAGFAATAEAQQYLAPGKRGRINVALLEANADLLLGDLLKNTKASQTFRLFASPDARVHRVDDGEVSIELLGMDAFDAATGEVTSRNQDEIAAWFLDHDYDGSVFHVNQAFFTRSNAWEALGKALKGTIDEEVVEAMHSFTSLPFTPGPSMKAAIRVVDDAGQTSEAILELGG